MTRILLDNEEVLEMGVQAKSFVEKIESAYSGKWGYIWGQSGTTWTQAKQDELEKKYNSNPTKYDNYKLGAMFGSRWIGKKVADCSGLPYCKLKEMGVRIYHGCNSIWKNDLSHKGEIKPGMKLPIGAAIFMDKNGDKSHMGILTTETCVTEAKTTQSGVVHTPLSNKKWTHWGLFKGVDYDFVPGEEPVASTKKESKTKTTATTKAAKKFTYPTLRRGSKGDLVYQLQDLLQKDGSTLEVDGIFGPGTMSAVRGFQQRHGLEVDGIVGPKTWAELLKLA